jgi:release factor glutamine methyltransferase
MNVLYRLNSTKLNRKFLMTTVNEILGRAKELESLSDTARLDTELLLGQVLNKERSWVFTWPDYQLEEQQLNSFNELFARRLSGEPVAHIIGSRGFWTLELEVNNTTLIPRPDTEILVESALELSLSATASVLDLGTGTGAIALALASERPAWSLLAVDKIEQSVELAKRNQHNLGFTNVDIQTSNWFASIAAGKRFDLIVSNPPYIDPMDNHLSAGDVRFEPASALVAGQNGMADLVTIATTAPRFLKPSGWLMVEHGYDQGLAVRELLIDQGFSQVQTRKIMVVRNELALDK